MTQLQLEKFVAVSIRPNAVIVVIGKRSTGKSTLVRDLLFHHRDIPSVSVTVVSPTEHFQRQFSDIVPPPQVHDEYSPAIIGAVVARQNITRASHAFIVLDNCMYDSSWVRDVNILQLVMGKNATSVFTMAYALGLPPSIRAHVDYVFLFREGHVGNRKRMYDAYGSDVFPTFDVFCQVMDKCTENHESLVIDRTMFEPRAFWYKADLHGPFRVGDSAGAVQSPVQVDDVRRMSSDELINLLAERGIGRAVAADDGRRASIQESGRFTSGEHVGDAYVNIVVKVDDGAVFDYGARIWCTRPMTPSHA